MVSICEEKKEMEIPFFRVESKFILLLLGNLNYYYLY